MMMVPSIEQVLLNRHRVIQWLRLLELLLLVSGAMPLVYWVMDETLRSGGGWWHFSSLAEHAALSAMFGIPGLALLALDRRLVKWIVPMPRSACPQCGHSLFHLTEPRCPECGCELPQSFVRPPRQTPRS